MTGIQESLLDLTTNSVRVIQAVPLTLTTSGITVSIPNPLGVSGTIFGATSDTGVGDSAGSMNAHLREMAKVLDDVWDSVNHEFRTSASVSVGSVGQGTGNAGTSPWAVSGSITVGSALPAGTNNIGKVDINSLPSLAQGTGNAGTSPWAVSGTVSIGNQPAVNQGVTANNAFWSVSGAVVTLNGSVFINGSLATIQQAQINTSSAGDTTVVSGSASKKIRVLGITLSTAAAVAVAWKSSGGSTISPAMNFGGAGGGMDIWRPEGYFCETLSGENLVINLSTGVGVQGNINYIVY